MIVCNCHSKYLLGSWSRVCASKNVGTQPPSITTLLSGYTLTAPQSAEDRAAPLHSFGNGVNVCTYSRSGSLCLYGYLSSSCNCNCYTTFLRIQQLHHHQHKRMDPIQAPAPARSAPAPPTLKTNNTNRAPHASCPLTSPLLGPPSRVP